MDDFYNSVSAEPKWYHWVDVSILFLIGVGFGIMVALWLISTLRLGNNLSGAQYLYNTPDKNTSNSSFTL